MANILGMTEDAEKYSKDAEERTDLINEFMWDEETGFYYHVNKNDHSFTFKNKDDLKRKEIIGFLALWSGVADEDQAARLVQHLKNPAEFYRKYGIPTLSADDPYYNPMGYWNGPVWLPWNYLVFRGLRDYNYFSEAADIFYRIKKNVSHQLQTNHYFWEFYSPDDLQAGWNKNYIWSGIIARFLIDMKNP
jgi:glycogen debranching enzyme